MQKLKSSGTAKASDRLLTDVELELMTILWQLGEGSVSDVIARLPEGRDLAYTSVSTILRILEQKKILKARKEGRGHIYVPQLSKNEFEAKTVKDLVHRVFDDTPVALIKQLVGSVALKDFEIDELQKILDEAKKKS